MRFVGVTGYPLGGLDKVTAAVPVDTVLTYCRYNLQDTSLAQWLPAFQQRGLGVINASVLAMGALTNRGAPPWHPAPADVLEACAKAAKLCTERGSDIAKVGLQFALALHRRRLYADRVRRPGQHGAQHRLGAGADRRRAARRRRSRPCARCAT